MPGATEHVNTQLTNAFKVSFNKTTPSPNTNTHRGQTNSHQRGALPHHSAGSAGSTAGVFHMAWSRVKEGHRWGRGETDSPSGYGPGSHKGHMWDISTDTETTNVFLKAS